MIETVVDTSSLGRRLIRQHDRGRRNCLNETSEIKVAGVWSTEGGGNYVVVIDRMQRRVFFSIVKLLRTVAAVKLIV